jgi:hypothetical protein
MYRHIIQVQLYNPKQECGHIEPLEKYLEDCENKILEGKSQDWILVGIGTYQEQSNFSTKIKYDRENYKRNILKD